MIRDEVRLERGMVYYRFGFGHVYAFAICADTHRVEFSTSFIPLSLQYILQTYTQITTK